MSNQLSSYLFITSAFVIFAYLLLVNCDAPSRRSAVRMYIILYIHGVVQMYEYTVYSSPFSACLMSPLFLLYKRYLMLRNP